MCQHLSPSLLTDFGDKAVDDNIFKGTNSVVSSLSSINSYGSERSLNLSDMANNVKMSKLLKIFEGKKSQGISGVPRPA